MVTAHVRTVQDVVDEPAVRARDARGRLESEATAGPAVCCFSTLHVRACILRIIGVLFHGARTDEAGAFCTCISYLPTRVSLTYSTGTYVRASRSLVVPFLFLNKLVRSSSQEKNKASSSTS